MEQNQEHIEIAEKVKKALLPLIHKFIDIDVDPKNNIIIVEAHSIRISTFFINYFLESAGLPWRVNGISAALITDEEGEHKIYWCATLTKVS